MSLWKRFKSLFNPQKIEEKRYEGEPELFYSKILDKGKIKYIFEYEKILDYIHKYQKHDEFIIITFLGKSQVGKSFEIQKLTGVKHKIGTIVTPETQGASIAYGGTIEDIYKRVDIKCAKNDFTSTRDVFICDTEGVFNENEKGSIAALLMPLLILSSKIVAVLPPTPESSITDFLEICKSFIVVTNNEISDPFKDKLIIRVNDYPQVVSKNPQKDFDESAKAFTENSEVARNFHKKNIYPIYIPGGPFDPTNKCHVKEFVKNLLDTIFSNQEDIITYSNPISFVNNARTINQSPLSEMGNVNLMFKQKNVAERIFDYVTIQIEQNINSYFAKCSEENEIDDSFLSHFFNDEVVVKLTNVAKSNKIEEKFLAEYIDKEKQFFNRCREKLQKRIKKNMQYKNNIANAKSEKEKKIVNLEYISEYVKNHAQDASDNIFYNVSNHFTKLDRYSYIIVDYINQQRQLCNDYLGNSQFSDSIIKGIQSDIRLIFDKLLEFPDFTFYRTHGLISRIIHFFADSVEEEEEGDEMVTGVWGIIDRKKKKYCRIIVDPRNYETTYESSVCKDIEKEIMSRLDEKQKEILINYMRKNNIKYMSDINDEQIKTIIKDQVKLFPTKN